MNLVLMPVLAKAAIDVDGTFFVQLAVFFFLLAFLYAALIKPYLRTVDAREELNEGAREEADDLVAESTRLADDYQDKLAAARREAQSVRENLRAQGGEAMNDSLAEVRAELSAKIEEERSALRAEIDKAHADIEERAEALASAMVDKVLPAA